MQWLGLWFLSCARCLSSVLSASVPSFFCSSVLVIGLVLVVVLVRLRLWCCSGCVHATSLPLCPPPPPVSCRVTFFYWAGSCSVSCSRSSAGSGSRSRSSSRSVLVATLVVVLVSFAWPISRPARPRISLSCLLCLVLDGFSLSWTGSREFWTGSDFVLVMVLDLGPVLAPGLVLVLTG